MSRRSSSKTTTPVGRHNQENLLCYNKIDKKQLMMMCHPDIYKSKTNIPTPKHSKRPSLEANKTQYLSKDNLFRVLTPKHSASSLHQDQVHIQSPVQPEFPGTKDSFFITSSTKKLPGIKRLQATASSFCLGPKKFKKKDQSECLIARKARFSSFYVDNCNYLKL